MLSVKTIACFLFILTLGASLQETASAQLTIFEIGGFESSNDRPWSLEYHYKYSLIPNLEHGRRLEDRCQIWFFGVRGQSGYFRRNCKGDLEGRTIKTRSTSESDYIQLNIGGPGGRRWWLGVYERRVQLDSFVVDNALMGFSDVDSRGAWLRWQRPLGASGGFGAFAGYDRLELDLRPFSTRKKSTVMAGVNHAADAGVFNYQGWLGTIKTQDLPRNWFIMARVSREVARFLDLRVNAGTYSKGLPMAFGSFGDLGAVTLFPYLGEGFVRRSLGQFYNSNVGFLSLEFVVAF